MFRPKTPIVPAAAGSTTANALATTTTSVNVSNAAAPEAGQVLVATSSTTAEYETLGHAHGLRQSVFEWMTTAQYADGQTGTPVLNVASAFTLAATNAKASVNFVGNSSTITQASLARIFVPAGRWTLGSLVDTGGNNIIWEMDAGAFITDYSNLNGRIDRPGQRLTDYTHGIYDYGNGYAVVMNAHAETGAQISGYAQESDLGTYSSRDSVAMYVSNSAPATTIAITSATYTSTTILPVTPLTTAQISKLRVGMIIDTLHTTKYSGFITGWTVGGTSITVEAWYLSGGGATPATPSSAGSLGANVNPITKVWAHNANIGLNTSSLARESCGFELGVFNNQAAYNSSTDYPRTWGFDSVNLGTYQCTSGYIQRGNFYRGFESYTDMTGYAAFSSRGTPTYHFHSSTFSVTQAGVVTGTSFSTGTAVWKSGAGTPEGVVTAAVGSLFTRTNGGAGTTLYVKESGTGNTGWVAK